MRRPVRSYTLVSVALGLCTIALLLIVTIPHAHDDSLPSDSDQWCRTCQLSNSFSAATPPVIPAMALPLAFIGFYALRQHVSPYTSDVARLPESRAPPA